MMENNKANLPRKALLVIDIQEDYTGTAATRPFPYKDSGKLLAAVNKITASALEKDYLVLYVRQAFEGFGGRMLSRLAGHGTAIKGTPGSRFDDRLSIVSDHCFTKPMPDAFTNPELEKLLKECHIDELYLVGLDAAGCVYMTAKGALKRGYGVTIIKDAILLLKEQKWDILMKKFEQDGITLITSEAL